MEEIQLAKDLKCVVCNGDNFYKESGYFFCTECQTQTQDVVEQVFEEFDVKQETKVARKISKSKVTQNRINLTTWECYNYIMKGLTEELVNLGAGDSLRIVVKKLWMKYLMKIQVINLETPKLQAVNAKIDAEIVYGKRRKRKRKRASRSSVISDSDFSTLDAGSLKRERAKRRKALIKAQYDQSVVLTQSMENSLANETLTSLRSSGDESSKSSMPLKFNKYAKKELRKHQSDEHLKEHMEDFDNTLSCHRNSYKEVSKKYANSSHVLSINKIYSILYLGLLLIKSKVQLGDMLRFIREGHLSFNNYKHFFPDEMKDNFLTQVFPRKYSLVSDWMRRSTFQLAKFLGVVNFLEVQNLAYLIDRYCIELNLPYQVKERVLSMLLITSPRMEIQGRMKAIPNYEARALSFILFQLKLLYGLDGKSEKLISENCDFDFMKWLKYLDYRNFVLEKVYFPVYFSRNKQMEHSDHFVQFLISKNPEYDLLDPNRKYTKSVDDIQNLLMKLKMKQEAIEEPTSFPASLTPFRDYTRQILKNQNHRVSNVEIEILKQNFEDSSVNFITTVQNLNEEIQDIPRGANENINMFKLINYEYDKRKNLKEGRRYEIFKIGSHNDNSSNSASIDSSIRVEEVEKYLQEFDKSHQNGESNSGENSSVRFRPHKRFWVNSHFNLGRLSKQDFDIHLSSYPGNFQFLLEEMAKIAEQSTQDILTEYTSTEIYLLYHETFQTSENTNIESLYTEPLMKSLARKAKKNW